MNLFDILGPIMVGPSSSHTAGAVRIGRVTMKLLGSVPKKAEIYLHGSFADTGVGHGTDKALIAGLLGMEPDDMRIPQSMEIAKEMGVDFCFREKHFREAHPNTAYLRVVDSNGKKLELQACSIGGGRILINEIDGIRADFNGDKPTLIVRNEDKPGHVAFVTTTLANAGINVATLVLNRSKRGGDAVIVIETDMNIPIEAIKEIENVSGIHKVTYLNLQE